ncbi:zinc finger protein ZXDC-like [Ptychodera flava]|uniref:zinc finger protein ZXDC-like n=1 Tax=Ptychodera flava TaxID=63121 RepID=UPI00396A355E
MDGNPDQNWQGQTQNGGAHEIGFSNTVISENNEQHSSIAAKERSEISQESISSIGPPEEVQNGGDDTVHSVGWEGVPPTVDTNQNNNSSQDIKVASIVDGHFGDQEGPIWNPDSQGSECLDSQDQEGMQDGGVKVGHPVLQETQSSGKSNVPVISQDHRSAVDLIDNITNVNESGQKLVKDFDLGSLIERNLGRDKSNTLMTPQELESMPDEGMEFEESVGPKHSASSSSLEDSSGVCNTFNDVLSTGDASEPFEPSDLTDTLEAVPNQVVENSTATQATASTSRSMDVSNSTFYIVTTTSTTKEDGTIQKVVTINPAQSRLLTSSAILTLPVQQSISTPTVTSSMSVTQTDMITTTARGIGLVDEQNTLAQTPVVSLPAVKTTDDPVIQRNDAANEMENEIPENEEMSDDEDEDDDDDESSGKVYFCPESGCGRKFNCKAKLKLHTSAHTGESRPFKCTYDNCVWAFTTSYKLKRHYAKHTGEKPFKCPADDCGKYYTTVYNLNSHMKIHCRPTTLYPCDVEGCGESFSTKRKLETHKRKHYDDKKFICDHPGCNKAFATSSALGSHIRSHQREEQVYPCTFEGCGKKFDKPCRLKLHLRSHTGERPYVCPFQGCEWAFTCLQKLTRHQRRHTGEKKYVCPEEGCGKAFTRAEHLKGHIVTHTGEKPFECPIAGCDAKFSARSSLYVHMKKHANTNDKGKERSGFDCPVQGCHKVYASKASLKTHINKLHNISTVALEANQFGFIYINPEDLSGTTLENITGAVEGTPTVVRISQVGQVEQSEDGTNYDLQVAAAATEAEQNSSFAQEGQFDNQGIDTANEAVGDYLTQTDVDQQIVSAANLQPEVMAQHVGNNVVTQFVVNADMAAISTDATNPSPEVAITSGSPLEYTTRVFQANNSGSARTDYSAIQGLLHRPAKRRRIFQNAPSPDLDKAAGDSDHSLDASKDCGESSAFTAGVVMTSSAITLRDPATGSHYVQTQLLQDDPPSDQDIPFHPDISLPAPSTCSDQSSISSELPVTILQEPTTNPDDDNPGESSVTEDFIETHSNSDTSVPTFTESTINLQDLE